ncbi:phasin family protein [Pseudoxanthomonas sp. 10H]|uniref:phasin family protein n=1 Tax=Pseudoxanthomonas sp. 10H TaxID=3242729 RepID=UPI0035577490
MSADPHHASGRGSVADFQAQASRIAREMGENAHQVWLAGIGALARAQSEGSRLFEQLAEEGRQVEDGEAPAGGAANRLDGLRQSLDAAMGRAQARAGEAWDSMGRMFEQRVQQALRQLDVPTRDDLDALGARIDALTLELQRSRAQAPADGSAAATPGVPPTV